MPASPQNDAPESLATVDIAAIRDGNYAHRPDHLAVEAPLEIRLAYEFLGKPAERAVAVTMRTPGNDHELAQGFLFGEGLIDGPQDLEAIDNVADNILRLQVKPYVKVDMASLQRNFYTTSSCGVCGKASIEALAIDDDPLTVEDWTLGPDFIAALPDKLRARQTLFEQTGGIHGAALFDTEANLLVLREDVGRHNAMDKIVGAQLAMDAISPAQSIVVWSGRASFELVQKAVRARLPVVVAVGAPSSLAVDVARQFGITLIGFARHQRFNIYTHPRRIDLPRG